MVKSIAEIETDGSLSEFDFRKAYLKVLDRIARALEKIENR